MTQSSKLRICVIAKDRSSLEKVSAWAHGAGHHVQRMISADNKRPSLPPVDTDVVLFEAELEVRSGQYGPGQMLPFFLSPPEAAVLARLSLVGAEPPVFLGGKAPAEALRNALNVCDSRSRMRRILPAQDTAPPTDTAPPIAPRSSGRSKCSPFDLIVLGISTGGPDALAQMLPQLHPRLSVPLLVVQHMPEHFTGALATKLNRLSPLPVALATAGALLQPGQILLAPGGQHMIVSYSPGRRTIELTRDAPVNNCRPSVDVLLDSIADANRGSNTLICIMTGMGSDGLRGTVRLAAQGAKVVCQSRETCTVWGMPRAVEQAGLADEILDLDAIPGRLSELVGPPT